MNKDQEKANKRDVIYLADVECFFLSDSPLIATSRFVWLVDWRQDEAAHRVGEDQHQREEVEVEHYELEAHHFVDQAVQLVH